MRYWYDTEFYESGPENPVRWISIGIVCEDGRELYLENGEFNWLWVPSNHFVFENVLPHLVGSESEVTRLEAQLRIRKFLTDNGTNFSNEIWAYYGAYDHVVLAQIFGRMVDMPQGVPWFTRDVKQEFERLRVFDNQLELPKQKSTEHHALADARWTKEAWEHLRDTEYRAWGVM